MVKHTEGSTGRHSRERRHSKGPRLVHVDFRDGNVQREREEDADEDSVDERPDIDDGPEPAESETTESDGFALEPLDQENGDRD